MPQDQSQATLAAPPKRLSAKEKVNLASGLSEKQRQLLDTLLLPEVKTIKQAAEILRWKADTAYQMMSRIGLGDAKAEGYHKEVSYYRVKLAKQGKRFLEP